MVGPTDVKWKASVSVWYWVNYVILTFDLTHELDLWFFKVNNCVRNSWSGWCELKGSESIIYLTDYMTVSFGHVHDLDPEFAMSKFEIAFLRNGRTEWHK